MYNSYENRQIREPVAEQVAQCSDNINKKLQKLRFFLFKLCHFCSYFDLKNLSNLKRAYEFDIALNGCLEKRIKVKTNKKS